MLEEWRQALARSGVFPRTAREAVDLLFIQGADSLTDPIDRDAWSDIFADPARLAILLDDARAFDDARARQELVERQARRRSGELPPAWRPPKPLACVERPTAEDVASVLPPWLGAEAATAGAVQSLVSHSWLRLPRRIQQ